jgi:hypothetical protein
MSGRTRTLLSEGCVHWEASMEIPGLGLMTEDEDLGWFVSEPIAIPPLGGNDRRVVVRGYEGDASPTDFHAAIKNLLSADESVLRHAAPYVYEYYTDMRAAWEEEGESTVSIASPDHVWEYVTLGRNVTVTRRHGGDKAVYISIECNCAWEPEHGLQLVFDHAMHVVKVGSYNGHLTNSDAYANKKYEGVVYLSRSMLFGGKRG